MVHMREWKRRLALPLSLMVVALALVSFGGVPALAQVSETQLESPPVQAPASFGQAVNIDGDTAVASAPDAAVGAVGVYTRNGTNWPLTATLAPPAVPEARFVVQNFGKRLALSGDTIVASGAFVDTVPFGGISESRPFFAAYGRDGGAWTLQAVTDVAIEERDAGAGANFIDAIAIDGNIVVVGDSDSNGVALRSGIAFVFERSGTGWQHVARLAPEGLESFDSFGDVVAVSGSTVAVSNPDFSRDNTVYLFNRDAGGSNAWGLVQTLTDAGGSRDFGESLALDGDNLIISTELLANSFAFDGTAAALVYERTGAGATPWNLVQTLTTPAQPEAFNTRRTAVALSGDRLIVSVLGSINNRGEPGTVYQFSRTDGSAAPWTLVDQFTNSRDNGGFDFGFDIALSVDQAIIGAPQLSAGIGAAFIYTLTGSSEPLPTSAPVATPQPTALPAPTATPTATPAPQPTALPAPQPEGGPFVFDVNIEFFDGPREGQRIRGTLELPRIFVTGPEERDNVIGTFTRRNGKQFPARLLILEPNRTQVNSFEINFNPNRSFEEANTVFFGQGGLFPNGEVRGTGQFANLNKDEISNGTFILTPQK